MLYRKHGFGGSVEHAILEYASGAVQRIILELGRRAAVNYQRILLRIPWAGSPVSSTSSISLHTPW